MSTLQELIEQNTTTSKALQSANAAHEANLKALTAALEPVFNEYEALFTPLAEKSWSLGTRLLEESPGRWGNSGLTRIVQGQNGYVTLHTRDYFRMETEYFEASMPAKYLVEGGRDLMKADAPRIEAELVEFQQRRESAATIAKETAERAELARLQTKYST